MGLNPIIILKLIISSMEFTPIEILVDILKFCTIPEIFLSCIRVNSTWKEGICNSYLLQYLVKREFNLRFIPNIPPTQSIRVLKTIKKRPGLLNFIGFSTSGGVDENLMRYWCSNLFRSEGEAYCTHDNAENCNVVGGLIDCLADPRTYFESEADVISAINQYLSGSVLDPFHAHALIEALRLLDRSRSHDNLIQMLQKSARPQIPSLSEVKRIPDNNYLLHHNIDIAHIEKSSYYAVIKSIKISRKGYYTCPVKALMVFVSDRYFDPTDDLFNLYNNLKDYSDVTRLVESNYKTPGIYKHFIGAKFEYCEFIPSFELEFSPILWLKFVGNHACVNLSNLFTGKYIYAKFIYPEDKRNGSHAGINIDCRHILPYGNCINLGEEYYN